MPQAFLLIDGYNLMHAAGMARFRYGPGDLQRCRVRFLRFLLRHLRPLERSRTTVVFDSRDAPPDASRRVIIEDMEILFADAGAGGDADLVIEDLIAAHSSPRQLRLVSSDHRLQRAARRRRAHFVDSESFVLELEARGPVAPSPTPQEEQPQHPKFTGQIPPAETEAWLKIFGDLPEVIESVQTQTPPECPLSETQTVQPDLDDVDFWQARVDELAKEFTDKEKPPADG